MVPSNAAWMFASSRTGFVSSARNLLISTANYEEEWSMIEYNSGRFVPCIRVHCASAGASYGIMNLASR